MFCSVDNCDSKHYANGYCQRHYQQIKIHGKIITLVKRTPYDPNEFIIDKNICWIILYNARGEEIAKAKIDVKYYDQIKLQYLKIIQDLERVYFKLKRED